MGQTVGGVWMLFTASAALSAVPAPRQITYAPTPSWVVPPPTATDATTPADAPFRIVYTDRQVRVSGAGEEVHTAYRMRLLTPEALQIGNMSLDWNPSDGAATVHRLHIVRDGRVIDVLKDQRFQIIQREGGLERSILNGELTATLQVAGLQVGDELEFAVTTLQRDPTLGDHAFGLSQLPLQGMPGAFRYRLTWPAATRMAWRATRDLPQAVPKTTDGQTSIGYELRDPGGVILNDGAPPRFNIRRLVEYSDFSTWRDVARRFAPLYDKAAILAPGSPLRAEAARIIAASAEPGTRAAAALQLVQDRIRYVYVGLDGGNYRPATADETWQRRFGDCKAKTVLLLALLREMKIEAEPVLANLTGGDGTDARLPSPASFNHVLVRAHVAGASYWLDGTRLGDRYLDMLPPPGFRWALALRPLGSDLEPVAQLAPIRPLFVSAVEIDARTGFESPAKVKVQHVLRQDEAYATRTQLAAMSPEDADRAVRGYWRQQMAWIEPDRVAWRYDARRATLLLSLEGQGKPGWKGSDAEGHSLDIVGAGFFPPDLRKRAKEQDQTAPWQTEFPRFKCYATSIRLPTATNRWRWSYYADTVDRRLAGTAYWRASGLTDGVMRTVMSTVVEQAEITADEASIANDAVPGFNNNISRVYQVAGRLKKGAAQPPAFAPFRENVDWTGSVPECAAPAAKSAVP